MIQFEHVSKVYETQNDENVALEDINIQIEEGEFVFVLGHSGAGKSTFLKLMLMEEKPTEGRVIINGQDLTRLRRRKVPYIRRQMGVVFQDFRLIPTMTVYENVAFAMRVTNISTKTIKNRVPFALSLVGLEDKMDRLPDELSGGEQQRVAVARALAHGPKLIIADEPTGNIDPEMSYEIVDLLNHINANGTTVVMVTHEHNLVRHFHHRVITIEEGSVVSDTSDTDKLPDDYASIEANYPTDSEPAKDEESPSKEEVLSDTTVEESKTSSFYFQPNEDKDLEDFMQNYGLTDDDIAEDTLDYSAYLSSDETSNGGDAK